MHFKTIAIFAASAAVVAGQNAALPSCARECFAQAIGKTSCSLTDEYCQCTEGLATIGTEVRPCLVQSTCTTSDVTEIQAVVASVCSAAVAAGAPDDSDDADDSDDDSTGSTSSSNSTSVGGTYSNSTSTPSNTGNTPSTPTAGSSSATTTAPVNAGASVGVGGALFALSFAAIFAL